MRKHPISFTINGDLQELFVGPRKTLLAVIRDTIGLTGTKEGCSTGDCGACTVIVDGETGHIMYDAWGQQQTVKRLRQSKGSPTPGSYTRSSKPFWRRADTSAAFALPALSWLPKRCLTTIPTCRKTKCGTRSAETSVGAPDIQK